MLQPQCFVCIEMKNAECWAPVEVCPSFIHVITANRRKISPFYFFFLKLELKIQVLPQHRHCWLSETHVQSWQLSNRGAMWSPGVLEREPGGMPKGSQRESVPSMGEQLNCPTCPFSVTCAVNRAGLGLLTFAQRSWKIFLGFLKWVWV